MGKSLGVAPYDVDGDGLVDIAVANDTVQNFLFHNKGDGKFEEIAILSGVAFDQSGSPRGGMGIDWAPFLNDERLGLAIGNFANEMTALYVCDQPESLAVLRPGQPLWPGCSDPAAAEVRPLLLRLRPRRPARPALGQRPPRARDLQGAGQRDATSSRCSSSGTRASPGDRCMLQVKPEKAGPDLFKPIVGRGSAYADIDGDGDLDVVVTVNNGPARLFRNDGGNNNHWIRLEPDRQRQDLQPRRHRRQGRAQGRRDGLPPPALPVQELSLVRRAAPDVRPGPGRPGR